MPIAHLGDMRALFDGIPLGEMNTSMTINATAAWLLALYIAARRGAGRRRGAAAGHDPERHHQGVPRRAAPTCSRPAPSLRLTADMIAFTVERGAEVEPDQRLLLPPAGGGRDAGAGARLRAGHRDRGARRACEASGEVDDERFGDGGRADLVLRQRRRALRRGARQDARLRRTVGRARRATATASPTPSSAASATACRSTRSASPRQQPENNVQRIVLEMLAVTLSKNARARAVQLPAWNEALGLPRPWDQQWSLRIQQILAYETDLLEYGDIFDGARRSPRKVGELKAEAQAELAAIDELGGAVAAVERAT